MHTQVQLWRCIKSKLFFNIPQFSWIKASSISTDGKNMHDNTKEKFIDMNKDSKVGLNTANWPPCHPWPLWPGSSGPVCSSRGGAAGGAGGLHRWWCCAPDVGGRTCGQIHQLPQRQTYPCPLLHGWTRCHTPAQTHWLFLIIHEHVEHVGFFLGADTHRPLCREQSAGSSHVQTPG